MGLFRITRTQICRMSNYKALTEHVLKPDLDDRFYRAIELRNKMKVLLIHDPSADKSAAALDVNVGAFNDPKGLPGLAHFCEHLLFMGTEKYPKENEYSTFLSHHSGHSNAYTSSQDTNYYFEVGSHSLEGALDRFAQFFISPLFSKDCKDREIRAVDSENKKNLQNDNWRLHQLDKSLTSPAHPYHGFSTGNYTTLGINPVEKGLDVRQELIEFYKSHYSANLMRLVILGKEDLDTLTSWAVEKFSQVPNSDKPRPHWESPPYDNPHLGKLIRAKPVMETRSLEISFPVPDMSEQWEYKPGSYYSHLLGHEGKGSLLYYLKGKGWANELSCGAMTISKGFAVFVVEVELTKDGFENYKEIVKNVFEYLKMLQEEKPQEWIFNELRDISKMHFKFTQKSSASSTASKLSAAMQKDWFLPLEEILSQGITSKWDPSLISQYGSFLNPENFRVMLVSPDFGPLSEKEKWYGTEHSVEVLDLDLQHIEVNSGLYLPQPNDFIPTDFNVERGSENENDTPGKLCKLISRTDQTSLWFKKDNQFWVPKAYIGVMFHIPIATSTPLNSALSMLYADLIDDSLNDVSYDASLVGLKYTIAPTRDGLSLKVNGYNDKMDHLLVKLVDELVNFTPSKERFQVVKEKLLRTYKNHSLSTPYTQVGQYSVSLLNEGSWLLEEECAALESGAEFEDLCSFSHLMWKQAYTEILIHGNFGKEDAVRLGNLVNERVFASAKSLSPSQLTTGRSLWLDSRKVWRYETELADAKNVNSCIEVFIQLGELDDLKTCVMADLVAQVASEPCFNQLRTQEQLGYVVFCGVKRTRTTVGLRVLVQSERTNDYLEFRIDEFLKRLGRIIHSFTEKEFDKNVQALIHRKLQKKKNLGEEFSKYWLEIASGYYDFTSHLKDVDLLKEVSNQDLIAFYTNNFLLPESNPRLIVHLNAQSPPAQEPLKLVNAAILNAFSELDNVEVSSNSVETLVEQVSKATDDKSFQKDETILSILQSEDFKALLPQDFPLTQFRDNLLQRIKNDLLSPVPQDYPRGEVITSIAEFKSVNRTTKTATSVEPLETFFDKDD